MKNTLLLIITTLVLGACSSHYGSFESNSFEKPHQYVGRAAGYSRSTNIMYIGGNRKFDMVNEAKLMMEANRPLAANEAYVNIRVDWRSTLWDFGFTKTVVMQADVIRFVSDTVTQKYSNEYYQLYSLKDTATKTDYTINSGDSLFTPHKGKTMVILSLNPFKKQFKVLVTKKTGRFKTKIGYRAIDKSFSTKKTNVVKGYKIGDNVAYSSNTGGGLILTGTIIALSLEAAIVSSSPVTKPEIVNYHAITQVNPKTN
ncbi:MAG: hypothetical protein MUC81_01940 [Bacteroidia bacterium]|jgi:hypothetical protein|nr:hypothetical protein [Bacteroidia bacterium]